MRRYLTWVTGHRALVIGVALTLFLGYRISGLHVIIDSKNMVPQTHPYIQATNFVEDHFGASQTLVVAISPKQGDIFQPAVLERVKRITEALAKAPHVFPDNILSLSAKKAKSVVGTDDGMEVRRLLETVPSTPAGLEALRRAVDTMPLYSNAIVSPDRRTTAIIAQFQNEVGLAGFQGYDRLPDLAGTLPAPLLTHHRTRVIGADAATVVGRYQVRSELAFSFTDNWDGKRPDIANPFLFGVVGADRTFGNYLNVNAQYLVRFIVHPHDPFAVEPDQQLLAVEEAVIRNELDTIQHGATVRVSDKWWNETLEGETLGVVLGPHASYAVRGKVTYAISDRWKGIIGFDYYDGTKPSFFRNLRDTSSVFAEVRLGL